MKKLLLCLPLLALFAAAFPGCSKQRQWNHDQRKAMREALRDYRKMVYLDDLTDAEFVLFTDQVAGTLENAYPVYVEFIQMEGVDDTVDMVVVTEIVDELNADARNMRHIFPYNLLVAQGVLPAGLDHEQQRAFYNCFAQQVNDTYQTMGLFFSTPSSPTRRTCPRSASCRASAPTISFQWVVTEIDITETVTPAPAQDAATANQ